MIELIRHAAVKSTCGMILLGKCHADCFHQGKYIGLKMSSKAEDQGFMTSHGRYVDRLKAYMIAARGNQIEEKPGEILFSEMLWSPTDFGKFKYDSIEGYY